MRQADGMAALCSDPADLRVVLEIEVPGERRRSVPVEGGGCLIGSGEFCDVRLAGAGIPLAHSEIHIDGGVIWMEAVDDGQLTINGQTCRRLALRDHDQIQIADCRITVRINPPDEALMLPDFPENLSELSALELCERVEAEQARLNDDEHRRLSGWSALLRELEDVLRQEPASSWEQEARIERTLQQLHAITESLAERARLLAQREAEFMESAGALQEAHERINSRLEQLLQQFLDGSLRASA
uniref:FHA domain-containing protein n=1 Tax=Schlesneria paludicola TaxID=360056 RepID=A0A7C4LQW3_9PLAN